MNVNEVIIRIVGQMDLAYGDAINQQEVRNIIEGVLYNYDLTPKETLPAIIDDMSDKIMLYLSVKKIEGGSINTIKTYRRILGRFADAMRRNVADITTMDIRVYLANFGKTGVANGTIITHTDVLRGFFNWLEAEDYINKSPMKRVKTVKKDGNIREALTPKDLEILRSGCKTLRETAIFETLFATGVRVSELVQMDKSDIDWQTLKLNVVGKGQKERTVFLNAKAEVHLKSYLESRDDNCDALFVTERKPITRISVSSVQREVNIIAKRSGLKKNVHPHIFRHTFSTQLLANGASISSISKMLGHSSLSTTEIYSKMSSVNIEHEYRKHMPN